MDIFVEIFVEISLKETPQRPNKVLSIFLISLSNKLSRLELVMSQHVPLHCFALSTADKTFLETCFRSS